jgi:hypothetical protein
MTIGTYPKDANGKAVVSTHDRDGGFDIYVGSQFVAWMQNDALEATLLANAIAGGILEIYGDAPGPNATTEVAPCEHQVRCSTCRHSKVKGAP